MSKWINFDYVKSKKRFDMKTMHHSVWMQDIYSAPSIELIRCAECIWRDKDNQGGVYCTYVKGLADINDESFCSWGERREP